MDDAGLEHAAILLMAVGEEEAAEVFKYLSPKEVQRLGETMARLRTVPREKIDDVIGRFHSTKENQYSLVRDTDAFVSQVLKRALGEEKAGMLLDRILQGRDVSGIESLKWMDPGTIAEILNFLGNTLETAAVESIREHDADLAQKILDQMFTFDNLNELDDRAIQLLLREIQSESLIVALKGSDQALRDKIFKNMSGRAAETLREDLEAKGPVRISEVEAEQREILKVVRRLADEGQIQVGAKGGDDAFI
jgi:flagellar motor switch protein FliG